MVYQPSSPLTMSGAKVALAEGLLAIESGATGIDLSLVQVVDSATVALLLAWQRAATVHGTALAFLNASSSLISLAKMYSVDELLSFPADASHEVNSAPR